MSEDYLGLDAIVGKDAQPAFFVGQPAASDEVLQLTEKQHRYGGAKFPGALNPIFIFVDEDGGEERLEEGQPTLWRALMSWPREPTLAEVEAFKMHQLGRLTAAYWEEFVALDAAMARPRR